jgi:hypothetical protein
VLGAAAARGGLVLKESREWPTAAACMGGLRQADPGVLLVVNPRATTEVVDDRLLAPRFL